MRRTFFHIVHPDAQLGLAPSDDNRRMGIDEWPRSIGLVGSGRVAWALGRASKASGIGVCWVAGRDAAGVSALATFVDADAPPWHLDAPGRGLSLIPDLTVVAVSDDALDLVAGQLIGLGLPAAVHTCGTYGRDPLAPLADEGTLTGSWHPLQAFPTRDTELAAGVRYAITAEEPLLGRLAALARRLGGEPLHLAESDHARYHAAAAMASNCSGTLLYHASELLTACGLDRAEALAALLPLVRTTLAGFEAAGLPDGLTGPASRGDAGTLRRHLDALADAPAASDLYRACGRAVLPILTERGLPDNRIAAVRMALD